MNSVFPNFLFRYPNISIVFTYFSNCGQLKLGPITKPFLKTLDKLPPPAYLACCGDLWPSIVQLKRKKEKEEEEEKRSKRNVCSLTKACFFHLKRKERKKKKKNNSLERVTTSITENIFELE